MVSLIMYLVVGAVAGVLAGLFGIGGGTVIVPAVLFGLAAQGVSPDLAPHIAVATSLATIVFTSLSSIRSHHMLGAVQWPVVKLMAIGIVIGTALGAVVSTAIPGQVLLQIIGVFMALVGIQMFFGLQPKASDTTPQGKELTIAGTVIGFGSSWFGIGGGTFAVPYLTWRNFQMRSAVAISAACGLPIALTGALTYMVSGWGTANLPAWSTGFVYWPAAAGIVVTSVPCARIGAKLAHKLDQKKLKKAFAVLLMLVAAKFLLF